MNAGFYLEQPSREFWQLLERCGIYFEFRKMKWIHSGQNVCIPQEEGWYEVKASGQEGKSVCF